MLRLTTLLVLTLCAFAANSILCRLALTDPAIDAASFTTVRLASGAAALLLIVRVGMQRRLAVGSRSISSALMLFLYAAAFSFAYRSLSAGTGALLLFGAVQTTMMGVGLASGERLRTLEWTGFMLAVAGLVYLVLPGVTAPDPLGAGLMITAGAAWGVYSLLGRKTRDPLVGTVTNFVLAVPVSLVLSAVFIGDLHVTPRGLALAVVSGALTSGCGYVLWYAALRHLTAVRASLVQLPVPVLTAWAGVLVLEELLTLRLVLAAGAILGGVALALRGKVR